MSLIPLSSQSALFQEKISLVATDMDGTLTQNGRFNSSLLQSLEALAKAKIAVIIVTGRSAGWVQGLKNYLPVAGAIAENGGVFYSADSESPKLLTPIPDLKLHRQELAQIFAQLQVNFPQITESADNYFRVTDWTFDVQGLTSTELTQIQKFCLEKGWGFTYSTIQCHIKPVQQDKASSLLQVLEQYFPHLSTNQVVTVGDSPNDESLFDSRNFPLSVGVANVRHFSEKLKFLPAYITTKEEEAGFRELVELLLKI